MVTIKNQKLIIEIDTPIPEEHLEGLKLGITEALQVQFRDEVDMDSDLFFGNYWLCELMKALVETGEWNMRN